MSITTPHRHNHANMYGLARHPGHYDRVAGILARPLYRRVVADVTAAAPAAGSVVLDVGTGPGRLARLIAGGCPTVTVEGVDLSQEMITSATSTTRLEGIENVRFQVADVTSLPFADGSVNLVVSTISLHHWDDPVAGLTEIARVLAPGWACLDLRLPCSPSRTRPDRLGAGDRPHAGKPPDRNRSPEPNRPTRAQYPCLALGSTTQAAKSAATMAGACLARTAKRRGGTEAALMDVLFGQRRSGESARSAVISTVSACGNGPTASTEAFSRACCSVRIPGNGMIDGSRANR